MDFSEQLLPKEEWIPIPQPNIGDLLQFRLWSAAGWIRPMYFCSLIIVFFILLIMLSALFSFNGWIIFFGIIMILLLAVFCVLYQRVIFELMMAVLQLPQLLRVVTRMYKQLEAEYHNQTIDVNTNNINNNNINSLTTTNGNTNV